MSDWTEIKRQYDIVSLAYVDFKKKTLAVLWYLFCILNENSIHMNLNETDHFHFQRGIACPISSTLTILIKL